MSHSVHSTRFARTLAAAAAIGAAALIIAGCSSSDDATSAGDGHNGQHQATSSSSGAEASVHNASVHNDADVMFNQMMIPHHEQAVEMADLVASRTDNAELISLATTIKNAQQPEIDQMTGRLESWGVAVDSDGHMSHGSMGGMMSDAQMQALVGASGAQFDTLWLRGMIAHHQGAITMADTELADGENPESRELATHIKDSQQAEIDQMQRMLG